MSGECRGSGAPRRDRDRQIQSASGLRWSPFPGRSPARVKHLLRVCLVFVIPLDGLRDVGADGRGVDDVIELQVPGLEDRGPGSQHTSRVVEEDSVEEAQADALSCRLDRTDSGTPVATQRVGKDPVLDRDIEAGLRGSDGVVEGDHHRGRSGVDIGKVALKCGAAHVVPPDHRNRSGRNDANERGSTASSIISVAGPAFVALLSVARPRRSSRRDAPAC